MITEEQKEEALKLLEDYEKEQTHNIRYSIEQDCPSKDYLPIEKGEEQTGECMSDGHYLCEGCQYKC